MPAKINKTNRMAVTMKDGAKVISENQASSESFTKTGETISLNQVHMSVRGTGMTTLVIGSRRFDRRDPKLYATLRELVKKVEPALNLPPSGPGLEELGGQLAALEDMNAELRAMLDRAVADHETTVADLKQRLAEAEAAVLAATAPAAETSTTP